MKKSIFLAILMFSIVSAYVILPIDRPTKSEVLSGIQIRVMIDANCTMFSPTNKTCYSPFYISGTQVTAAAISTDDFRTKVIVKDKKLLKAIDLFNETIVKNECIKWNVTEEGDKNCSKYIKIIETNQYGRFQEVKGIKIEKGWYAGMTSYNNKDAINIIDQVNYSKTSIDPNVNICPIDIRGSGTYSITGTLNSSKTCITVNAPNVTIEGNWNLIHFGWAASGNWLQATNKSAGGIGNYLNISHLYILQTNFSGIGSQTNIKNQFNVTIDGLSNYPGFTTFSTAAYLPCIDIFNASNVMIKNITVSTGGGATNPIRISGPATNLTIINSILNSTGSLGQAYPIQLSTVKNAFLENLTLATTTTKSSCIYMSGSGQNITMNNIFCNNSNGANENYIICVGDISSARNINLTNFVMINGGKGISAAGQNLRIENGTVRIFNGTRGANGFGILIGTSSNQVNIRNVNITSTQSGIAGLSVTAANVSNILINIENVSSNVNYTRALHYGIYLAGTGNVMTNVNVSSNVNNTRCTGGSSLNMSYVNANCSGNNSVGVSGQAWGSGPASINIYNSNLSTNDSFSPVISLAGPLYVYNSTLRYVGSNYSMYLTSALTAGTRNFTFDSCDINFSSGTNYIIERSNMAGYPNVYFLNVTNATAYAFLFKDYTPTVTPTNLSFAAIQEYVRGNVTDSQNVSIENASFIATPIPVTCPNATNMSYTGADGLTNYSILTQQIFYDTNTTVAYTWNFTANKSGYLENSTGPVPIGKESTVWVILPKPNLQSWGNCSIIRWLNRNPFMFKFLNIMAKPS